MFADGGSEREVVFVDEEVSGKSGGVDDADVFLVLGEDGDLLCGDAIGVDSENDDDRNDSVHAEMDMGVESSLIISLSDYKSSCFLGIE